MIYVGVDIAKLNHFASAISSDSALSIQITHSIAQIKLLDSQLSKIEEEMTDIMKFNDSVIMTIPGIGYINGGMILCEIGNIHRFSSPGKLLAFAGLDPSVYYIDRSLGEGLFTVSRFLSIPLSTNLQIT